MTTSPLSLCAANPSASLRELLHIIQPVDHLAATPAPSFIPAPHSSHRPPANLHPTGRADPLRLLSNPLRGIARGAPLGGPSSLARAFFCPQPRSPPDGCIIRPPTPYAPPGPSRFGPRRLTAPPGFADRPQSLAALGPAPLAARASAGGQGSAGGGRPNFEEEKWNKSTSSH